MLTTLLSLSSCDYATDDFRIHNSTRDSLYVYSKLMLKDGRVKRASTVVAPTDTQGLSLVNSEWREEIEYVEKIKLYYTSEFVMVTRFTPRATGPVDSLSLTPSQVKENWLITIGN
jgi:hypothetical protein